MMYRADSAISSTITRDDRRNPLALSSAVVPQAPDGEDPSSWARGPNGTRRPCFDRRASHRGGVLRQSTTGRRNGDGQRGPCFPRFSGKMTFPENTVGGGHCRGPRPSFVRPVQRCARHHASGTDHITEHPRRTTGPALRKLRGRPRWMPVTPPPITLRPLSGRYC